MKLKVTFKAKEEKIPISYRMMILSIIKKALELGDKELFQRLYYYGDKKNKKIKPFCFAVYLDGFKIEDNMITENKNIIITINTPDYNIGLALYNGLLKIKEHKYNNYTLVKEKISLEKEKEIILNEVVLKTLSPIVIRDKENKPISVEDDNYESELNYICNLILSSYRGYGLIEQLKFNSINMKKNVIKEKIEGFSQISNKEFIYINAYSGIFKLKGNKEDLKLLMQLGLGFRRSEGFGAIDLV